MLHDRPEGGPYTGPHCSGRNGSHGLDGREKLPELEDSVLDCFIFCGCVRGSSWADLGGARVGGCCLDEPCQGEACSGRACTGVNGLRLNGAGIGMSNLGLLELEEEGKG